METAKRPDVMENTFYQQPPLYWMMAPFKPTFKLFIACEDQAAYFQARKVQDQVQALCGNEIKISHSFWSFALLRQQALRKEAALEAAEADMIIISLGENNELPPHVKALLESLPARSQASQAALVSLIGTNTEIDENPEVPITYLRQIAENCSLDFFCNKDGWERLDLSKPTYRRGEIRTVAPENILAQLP
jgi:hypothetical protein